MQLHLPLVSKNEAWTASCPGRFITVSGRTGYQPSRMDAVASVTTMLHQKPEGTLSFWFLSLEDMGTVPLVQHVMSDPCSIIFPLVSDNLPARDYENSLFGVFWSARWYPKLLAKFCHGRLFPAMTFLKEPWVYAEHLPLRAGHWYCLTLTWSRSRHELDLYINGHLIGFNRQADRFVDSRPTLYIGNPMMVVSDLMLEDKIWPVSQIQRQYRVERAMENDAIDQEIKSICHPQEGCLDRAERGREWEEKLALEFTKPEDLQGWSRQGPRYQPLPQLSATSEGLIIQTPSEKGDDTRTYLWSPFCFEGDQWIEYEFRPESERGLSLFVFCASGTQREDYFVDHGWPKSGGMKTIIGDRLRNYHWEYFRRVEAIRSDCETQLLCKNPWQHPLGYTCIPRHELGRWYRLRVTKIGPNIRGSIDGNLIFDVEDTAFGASGPIYDFGRIAFRQMYETTMRYRNLTVHTRPSLRMTVRST